MYEEKDRLAAQLDKQEAEYRDVTKSLRAEVAKLEVQLQEREKQAVEFKQLVSRLEQEVRVCFLCTINKRGHELLSPKVIIVRLPIHGIMSQVVDSLLR